MALAMVQEQLEITQIQSERLYQIHILQNPQQRMIFTKLIQQVHEDINNKKETTLSIEQTVKGFKYMMSRKEHTKKVRNKMVELQKQKEAMGEGESIEESW